MYFLVFLGLKWEMDLAVGEMENVLRMDLDTCVCYVGVGSVWVSGSGLGLSG